MLSARRGRRRGRAARCGTGSTGRRLVRIRRSEGGQWRWRSRGGLQRGTVPETGAVRLREPDRRRRRAGAGVRAATRARLRCRPAPSRCGPTSPGCLSKALTHLRRGVTSTRRPWPKRKRPAWHYVWPTSSRRRSAASGSKTDCWSASRTTTTDLAAFTTCCFNCPGPTFSPPTTTRSWSEPRRSSLLSNGKFRWSSSCNGELDSAAAGSLVPFSQVGLSHSPG
jgi:hypothetical protein